MAVAGVGKGGGGCLGIRTVICCGGTCGTSVSAGDVGDDPVHWEDTRRLPLQGGLHVDGAEAKEKDR